ncbi:MAG TPA: glycine cleavage system protein H [Gemmataceae bacterium]|nr:glycine cleavage system protein H [Gemmataceae bacterium]
MPEDLIFLMGKFEAVLPGGLRYARNHMWCRPLTPTPLPPVLGESGRGEGRYAFGFTTYAMRLMQDVYFLDWIVGDGTDVQPGQHIGHIETSKAVSDLFAPMAGTITGFNKELLDDPSTINLDNHGAGWLFEMAGDAGGLLTAAEYHKHLADNWEKTQRLIKGKINEDI